MPEIHEDCGDHFFRRRIGIDPPDFEIGVHSRHCTHNATVAVRIPDNVATRFARFVADHRASIDAGMVVSKMKESPLPKLEWSRGLATNAPLIAELDFGEHYDGWRFEIETVDDGTHHLWAVFDGESVPLSKGDASLADAKRRAELMSVVMMVGVK